MQNQGCTCFSAPLGVASSGVGLLKHTIVGFAFQLSLYRTLPCLPERPVGMERKAQAELEGRGDDRAPKHKSSGNASIDTINTMQIRMLKADASPMKKKLAKACSQGMQHTGFDVWLHVYDLGPISQWMNSLSAKESNLGAFHCGVEVLGVEWSFQAMIDCETDEMTGVMCHTPKSHARHVYKESIFLGESNLSANEICNVLARLERDWPARSYHFLSHNCTDFAEALAVSLSVPTRFPRWAHGLAKGLTQKQGPTDSSENTPPWWMPNVFGTCCGSQSCASQSCSMQNDPKFLKKPFAETLIPGCNELCLASKSQTPYKHA